jgi:hypothetical protein
VGGPGIDYSTPYLLLSAGSLQWGSPKQPHTQTNGHKSGINHTPPFTTTLHTPLRIFNVHLFSLIFIFICFNIHLFSLIFIFNIHLFVLSIYLISGLPLALLPSTFALYTLLTIISSSILST